MKINTLKFYYELKHENVPVYFESYHVLTQEEIHGRDTRFNNLIPRNVTRTVIQQNCLRQYLPIILNSTNANILNKITTHSYNGFSNYARDRFIEEYKLECQITNSYICKK